MTTTIRPLTAEERGINLPIPFGWYMLDYAADLAIGQVKPLRYFGEEIVLYRGEDGVARALHAYCRHLGAHMGHGGKVKGNNLECPFHACPPEARSPDFLSGCGESARTKVCH